MSPAAPSPNTYKDRWALVTGASSGLGAAFAEALAARGANVALTARRVDRLDALAKKLEAAHAVTAAVAPADLTDRGAPARVALALQNRGIAPDILINNAGYAVPGEYHETEWPRHEAFLDLMVGAYAHFARLALPQMRARGYGRIVNVASLAGLTPGMARHTLYGPAKAFLVSFSEALAAESRGHGVRVSALCPGLTRTEFHDVLGNRARVQRLPSFVFGNALETATAALDQLERGRVIYVPGFFNKTVAAAARLGPRPLTAAIARIGSKAVRSPTDAKPSSRSRR
ncbi:MAG: SDR family NAD(P)-dependent oxidoreductase [Parvularculaceae bacterium]